MTDPRHPYTELLMESVPKVGEKWDKNVALPDVEIAEYDIQACKFAARCPYARDVCRAHKPPVVDVGDDRWALCFKPVDYSLDYVPASQADREATKGEE
jgi:peptide/nickel transport system ATP-binding protein